MREWNLLFIVFVFLSKHYTCWNPASWEVAGCSLLMGSRSLVFFLICAGTNFHSYFSRLLYQNLQIVFHLIFSPLSSWEGGKVELIFHPECFTRTEFSVFSEASQYICAMCSVLGFFLSKIIYLKKNIAIKI